MSYELQTVTSKLSFSAALFSASAVGSAFKNTKRSWNNGMLGVKTIELCVSDAMYSLLEGLGSVAAEGHT